MTMAATVGREVRTGGMTAEERKVIFASSLGTVFEWYDFYIYGTLGAFLAKYFFSNVPPNVGFIFALLAFAAGFAVRPFGALIFGRLGDMIGRKYTFLVTMSLMGVGTFFIGLLPGYATWGIAAPIVLIALRLIQGLALGGEYGGAAIYVAEHAPANKRGYYTSWIQTTATLGLFMALLLILGVRTWMGEAAFGDWGWRIPFLLSGILLAVSIWIRLSLNKSPIFAKMKEEGTTSKRPLSEAFGQWANAKIAILALLGATAGEAVVWYGGQFYALFFLTQTLKVPGVTAQIMIVVALALGTPGFVIFGWLSDKIGRKPIILAGFLLAALTYFPIFKAITHYANPKLETALASSPVTVIADPAECSFQFKATGTEKFTTSCDVAKSGARQPVGELQQRSRASGHQGQGENRRSDPGGRQSRLCQATGCGDQSPWLSGFRGSGRDQPRHDDGHAVVAGDLCDAGLCTDCRMAGGVVPEPNPLQRFVVALSYRQRLVRRLPARDRIRDRGSHRKYLFRSLVPDRRRPYEPGHRLPVPAGNQGRRHHQDLRFFLAATAARRGQHNKPAVERSAAGFFQGLPNVADKLQYDLTPMRTAAMLDQIDRLPRSKGEFAVKDRNLQRGRRQHGLDVRRHIIGSLGIVAPTRMLRRQPVECGRQIRKHRRIGVFLNRQRRRGMANEQRHHALDRAGVLCKACDLGGEIDKAASRCLSGETRRYDRGRADGRRRRARY